MYPTKVVDVDSLHACLDRMYKNYTDFCVNHNGSDHIMNKEVWILNLIANGILEETVVAFNERELNLMSN